MKNSYSVTFIRILPYGKNMQEECRQITSDRKLSICDASIIKARLEQSLKIKVKKIISVVDDNILKGVTVI